MNEKTLRKICKEKNINFDDFVENCGWQISELRLYKGEIFKPYIYHCGKPFYKYLAQYQIILEDCV